MKPKKQKPLYRKFRAPLPRQTGGAHTPDKGGKYRRGKEKESSRKEIVAELS